MFKLWSGDEFLGRSEEIFTEKNQDNLLELLNFIKDTVLEGKGFKNYIKPYEVFLGKNITDLLPVNTGIKSLDDINKSILFETMCGLIIPRALPENKNFLKYKFGRSSINNWNILLINKWLFIFKTFFSLKKEIKIQ